MASAAERTGTGPMAAVAGAIAQHAAAAVVGTPPADDTGGPTGAPDSPRRGAPPHIDCIVDNGGDIYLHLQEEALVGVYAGDSGSIPPLALRVTPNATPLAICSSSSRMGHSTSLGNCDLATVLSRNGALADAAATAACNSVHGVGNIQPTLERIGAITGVIGVILINAGHVGLYGNLPHIERIAAPPIRRKIAGLE